MINEIANTILITTKCSAGCQHCPFSRSDIETLFLKPSTIEKIIREDSSVSLFRFAK